MSDDLRNRFKNVLRDDEESSDDIFSIWKQQERMRAEDQRIALEIKEARKRAKDLKKTLKSHTYGTKNSSTISLLHRVSKRFKTLFTHLLHPRHALDELRRIKIIIPLTAVAISLVVFSGYHLVSDNDEQKKATLGENINSESISTSELPREKPAEFDLLFPDGKSEKDFEVVRISPDGTAPTFTYVDSFGTNSNLFRVSQQVVPENFDIDEVAKGFQATDVIQVDDSQIFHGYSEQGNIQSLIFIKNDILFSIRSTGKYSDEQWAAYVTSLQ